MRMLDTITAIILAVVFGLLASALLALVFLPIPTS
jgi:hypothetical protein